MPDTIYLDYNATTPLDPGVKGAMMPLLGDVWGNPSSIHHVGRTARSLLDDLRARTAAVFACKPSEVVFTSGGTESNNLAILGAARALRAKGRHLITSAIEHHAVLNCFKYLALHEGFEVSILPVDSEGRVSIQSLMESLRPDTVLVSIMAANNEIGALQPVPEIGKLCRDRGVCFHSDAVQWFGKMPFEDIHQFNADLVSLCAHKFHGPKGAGALFVRSPLLLEPLLIGGGQEKEQRAGTENLAAIYGLVVALESFVKLPVFEAGAIQKLAAQVAESISLIPGTKLVSPKSKVLPNTVSFVVDGTDSFALLAGLDVEGVCASAGSACSAGSLEPSHVVSALGLPKSLARSFIRLSLGRENSESDIEKVCRLLPRVIRRSKGC